MVRASGTQMDIPHRPVWLTNGHFDPPHSSGERTGKSKRRLIPTPEEIRKAARRQEHLKRGAVGLNGLAAVLVAVLIVLAAVLLYEAQDSTSQKGPILSMVYFGSCSFVFGIVGVFAALEKTKIAIVLLRLVILLTALMGLLSIVASSFTLMEGIRLGKEESQDCITTLHCTASPHYGKLSFWNSLVGSFAIVTVIVQLAAGIYSLLWSREFSRKRLNVFTVEEFI